MKRFTDWMFDHAHAMSGVLGAIVGTMVFAAIVGEEGGESALALAVLVGFAFYVAFFFGILLVVAALRRLYR